MKRIYKNLSLLAIFTALFSLSGLSQNAWINEIHYDDASTDNDEFIEVAIENPGSYTLSLFSVVLYNFTGGALYDTKTLDLFTEGTTSNGITLYYYMYPVNGIQNGEQDGIALAYNGIVISGQFLSYEGVLTASDGPAAGMTSVDIGVAESGEPEGLSLQLSGTGTMYADFAWQPPAAETSGQLNNGQSFGGAPLPEPSNYPTAFASDLYKIAVTLTWTDATGTQLPSNYLIKLSDADNITPPSDGVPEANDLDFSDGTGALNVAYGNETCLFYPLEDETDYFFKIYPYTNAGTNINFKTDGTAPSTSATTVPVIHYEGFETNSFGTWTTYSVASDKDWGVVNFGGPYNTTYFAQMNGYNEDVPSDDWLISPSLNLDIYGNEQLEFFTQWKFSDTDEELTLKYSTNYTGGDPSLATWTDLSFTKPSEQDIWVSSGDVSLAGIIGTDVHLAFQYLSSGTPRRWGVDEIIITGGAALPNISVTSPVTGNAWEQGTSHDITWTADNTLANVMIELTSDASSGSPTWTTLVASVPADAGTWTWDIPSSQPISEDCQIRITDIVADVFGLSGIFSVIEPIYIPQLMITEIMYNPPESGTDSLEYIEIYNNDDNSVDLEGYYFSEGVEFTFPAVTLNSGEYFLVAVDSLIFQEFFGVMAYQFNGGISNSGEMLSIYNNYDMLVDSVNFADADPWPTEPDGNGPSLTFCDTGLDNGLGGNWSASVEFVAENAAGDSIFGSPGAGCGSWPLAAFSADTTIVVAGVSINFTDESTGDPDEWIWTFTGGTPSSYNGQTPPPITYNSAGTYDVILYVSNAVGSSTEEKLDYIFVGYPPTADFSGTPLNLYAGEKVDFTDLSTEDPDTWFWEFEGGDPATSTIQNPADILYAEPGLYDVTLTVTNLFGTDVIVKEDYIDVLPVGIDEPSESAIRIYPNPNDGNFRLVNPFNVELLVSVYSIYGQLVTEIMIQPGDHPIALTGAAEGIYVISYGNQDGKIRRTQRMVIF